MSSETEPEWVNQRAVFPDSQHRTWLRRDLAGRGPPVGFILHNPSIASATIDSHTSKRVISFATALDASVLIVVNAATGIATDADDLAAMEDPIGSFADEALRVAAEYCARRGGTLIAAYGAPKGMARTKRLMRGRFATILALGLPLHYLRLTKSGYPEHPARLPDGLRPYRWSYET